MTFRGVLAYIALWAPLLLIYTMLIGIPNRLPIAEAVFSALHTVGVAAVLGVMAIWWARLLVTRHLDTSDEGAPWSPVRGHVAGALVYSIAWSAYIVNGIREEFGSWQAMVEQVRPWLAWQLFFGAVVYAMLAGVTWALHAGERNRQREARLRQAEAERARAELAALRSRVEPHFLYNALHTATALVRRNPAGAEQALEQLASMLRYVLDPERGAREAVPLDEELQFVELYLAIERARLGDRLQVETDVDDEARDVLVPSLSLQPLIENAVRHGVAPRPEGGRIVVRGTLHEQHLLLSVADDGPGAAREVAAGETTGHGIGLDALRRRLAACYGERANLSVDGTPGEGFRVLLSIPV